MSVDCIDGRDRKALRAFVALERNMWGHEPLYWAEPDADLIRRFRGESAFNREMEHALFVVDRSSTEPAARAVGYVNRRWQRQREMNAGFIGNFCFAPGCDVEEAIELFAAVEEWLQQRGCTHSICGVDGTGALGVGVLTSDHEASPMYPLKWHPPLYAELIQASGYESIRRFWTYSIRFDNDRYRSASLRARREPGCEVRPVNRRHWKREVELVRLLFNETFADEWEMNEYTEDEFIETWGEMKWFLDPQALLIAQVEGEVAGFCVGLPDITPLIRSFQGRMGPIQILRMLSGIRKVERHGLFVVGVLERFRGLHIAQTLACKLYDHYERQGFRSALYYYVDDENLASRHVAESLGGEGEVRLRCYQKPL